MSTVFESQGSTQSITKEASSESMNAVSTVEGGSTGGSGSVANTPNRKRAHPTSLGIDEGAPPNKRLNTPTKEDKERILSEKQILYQRLAEEQKHPFFHNPPQQKVFPLFLNKPGFSPVYSLLQTSPPQANSPYSVPMTPSSTQTPNSEVTIGGSVVTAQPSGSTLLNPATVIGSGVGSPQRSAYPSQLYSSLLKYPFSPPTPSNMTGLSLLSPWNPVGNGVVGAANLQQLSGGNLVPTSISSPGFGSSSTPRGEASRTENTNSDGKSSTKEPGKTGNSHAPQVIGSVASPWQAQSLHQLAQNGGVATVSTSNPPAGLSHLIKSPRSNPASIQSPLSIFHPSPLSPMMLMQSPYSVSSCPSVSSSSGCSSDGNNGPTKNYAQSEYHVGPRRPISEKIAEEDNQSEGGNNSGRNTPVSGATDDNSVVIPSTIDVANALNRQPARVGPGNGPSTPASAIGSYPPAPPPSSSEAVRNPLSGVSSQQVYSGLATHSQRVSSAPGAGGGMKQQQYVQQQQQQQQQRGGRGRSPYPFSVESLSGGQPSSVGSTSHYYMSGVNATGSVERPSSGVSSMSSSLSSRDSTPEPDELKHDLHHPHNSQSGEMGGDYFCLVPGRLSLLSSTQKYKVSVDEVRRRLSHPECLNASVLGGILRRAKSKNGGHALRQRLESFGLSLPPGRRKATDLSLLTSLVEGEAQHLASDFQRLCDNFFPNTELAQIIARQHTGTPDAANRINMVKATLLIISEFQAMLNTVGGPNNITPSDPNNPYPGLTNFSLLTHGFGNPTISTSLGVLQNYLQELLAFYEERKPIQPDNTHLYSSDKLQQPASSSSSSSNPLAYSNSIAQQQGHTRHLQSVLKKEPLGSPNDCLS